MIFLTIPFYTSLKIIRAFNSVRRKLPGWREEHADEMMSCFIWSIQGAGPIRSIMQIQSWLNRGPVFCQLQRHALASKCQPEYINRLFLVALWTSYVHGVYVKKKGPGRANTALYERDCDSTNVWNAVLLVKLPS